MTTDTNGARLLADEAGHVIYQRDAVPLGPFDIDPIGLWQHIDRTTGATGADMRSAAAAWLLGALVDAGVDVRAFDRTAARTLADESGVPEIQTITGWIARARRTDAVSTPDHRRTPAERLLDALDHAGVTLGAYDAQLPRYLAESYGPRSVRAIAGWLGRVGRREVDG